MGDAAVPLSCGSKTRVSRSGYVPAATLTKTGLGSGPWAFSRRRASRAPARVASGPSVPAAFRPDSLPDQASLPSGATYRVTAGAAAAVRLNDKPTISAQQQTFSVCGRHGKAPCRWDSNTWRE